MVQQATVLPVVRRRRSGCSAEPPATCAFDPSGVAAPDPFQPVASAVRRAAVQFTAGEVSEVLLKLDRPAGVAVPGLMADYSSALVLPEANQRWTEATRKTSR